MGISYLQLAEQALDDYGDEDAVDFDVAAPAIVRSGGRSRRFH